MEFAQNPQNSEDIPDRLSRAWELLSGEKRRFRWNDTEHESPPLGECCFLLTLDLQPQETKAGIALLMSQADARTVAAAMFGVGPHTLSQQDLDDAGAEVCNVMADCASDLIAKREDLYTRLPQPLDAPTYHQLCHESGIAHALQSTVGRNTIHLLVFNAITPHFETRPCPLL